MLVFLMWSELPVLREHQLSNLVTVWRPWNKNFFIMDTFTERDIMKHDCTGHSQQYAGAEIQEKRISQQNPGK